MKKILAILLVLVVACGTHAYAQELVKTAKHEHQVGANGVTMDIYTFSDGSKIMVGRTPCTLCHQTGVCHVCHGRKTNYVGGYWYPCYICGASGNCPLCQGAGAMLHVVGLDGKSARYVFLNSAGAAGSGTAVIHDYSTGSSSSRPTDRTYVEKVEYAPDYTGENVRVYCDKCGCYAYPHAHIKKAVK